MDGPDSTASGTDSQRNRRDRDDREREALNQTVCSDPSVWLLPPLLSSLLWSVCTQELASRQWPATPRLLGMVTLILSPMMIPRHRETKGVCFWWICPCFVWQRLMFRFPQSGSYEPQRLCYGLNPISQPAVFARQDEIEHNNIWLSRWTNEQFRSRQNQIKTGLAKVIYSRWAEMGNPLRKMTASCQQ